MKKNRKQHEMFKKFKQESLSNEAKQQLKGGCGCGPDDGGSTPPPKKDKTSQATSPWGS